jgi:serine/threonine protein kinase/Flp pilus assembly protein TadD
MNRTVGHYEILQKLGQGGMGVVYKARDLRLDRLVALKMLSGERLDNVQRERLIREARTASALNHPNIVTIYEIDEADGVQLVAMEYVPGKSLAELIRPGGLSFTEVLGYAVQIAEAAGKAHEAGIIHRDLKPANIMVTPDAVVKILDFGLAKRYSLPDSVDDNLTVEAQLTRPGLVIGTVAYMSPEQANGEAVDARSDVFSLGVILYELLSGIRPFLGNTTLSTLQKIQIAEPAPLENIRPDLPRGLEQIIQKALQKDRNKRYRSMQELRRELLHVLEEITARQNSRPFVRQLRRGLSRPVRFVRRHLWTTAAVVLISLSLAKYSSIQHWLSELHIRSSPALVDPFSTAASALNASDWTSQAQIWLRRYDKANNTDRAVGAAKKALELDPVDAMAYAILAEAYSYKNGANPDPQWMRLAAESGRKAVELNADLAAAHLSYGIVLVTMHEWDEANRQLQRALELDPLNAKTNLWLGEYYSQRDDPKQAEPFYKRSISLDSTYWAAYSRYATFCFNHTRYADAVSIWEKGIRQTPDNTIILKNLGAAYHMLNKYEDASAAFQRALELQPTASVYSNLGTARFFQGRYADAAEAFEKAVELNPTYYLYWGNLGDARRWMPANEARAKQAYDHAIELASEQLAATLENPELESSLAVYYAKIGDRQHSNEALTQLKKMPKLTPGSHFKAMLAYEISEKREEALDELAAAIRADYSIVEIKNEPELVSLRKDRRYHEILARESRKN